ncbi:MAG TPA: CopG family transcriptional regulator [Tepidiformaceae bacterium]|nr:CopG family transcriptional regulator [Tepidiformaceae bacterium]
MTTHTVGPKLEVRLDPDRREKLARLAEARGSTIADLVRSLIDQAFAQSEVERRLAIVAELAAMGTEEMPEPDELSRELASAYDVDLP